MADTTDAPALATTIGAGSPQRLLAIGGIMLILAGMIFGDIFAVFILHPNNANIGNEMYLAAQAIMSGQPGIIFEHFSEIGRYLENRGTKVDTHNHIIQFGFLAIMLALVQPWVALKDSQRLKLTRLYMVGAVLLPPSVFAIHYVGLAYSPLSEIGWASIAADFGGFLVIVASLGFLIGLLKHAIGSGKRETLVGLDSWASRALLRGGSVLLLAGFLFGALYAATDYNRLQIQEIIILDGILNAAASQDPASVDSGFADFGAMAAEKAIKIATHAHINEMGMMALLLAFIQHLVFLSERWRRRWTMVFLVGALGLPISIMAELRFGLLAGGFADTFGLLLIISLFAMLFGVWRHTGQADSSGGSHA